MRKYTPRRASKRWLEGAPSYVLDCFDDKGSGDRYTVFFTEPFTISDGTFAGTYVQFLGMSDAPSHPQGVSMWGELKAYDAVRNRQAEKRHRIRWMDLPQHIREHVIARADLEEK